MRQALAAAAIVLALGAVLWVAFGDPTLFYPALGVATARIGTTALLRRQQRRRLAKR